MDISLQQIQYLLSLAEHLHFGRAAAACFVTQPTLSMQIKKAEEQLGVPVFDRKRNPLEITPFGKEILPYLHEIRADFSRMQQLSDQLRGLAKNELRIGIIPTIAAYMVPELFAQRSHFSDQTRWSVKEVKTEEILDLLAKRSIDVGILAGPIQQNQYVSHSLYNEEILAYTKSAGSKMHISQLKELHPWLLNQGNCLRSQMIRFCGLKEQSPDHDWDYEGGNLEMLVGMVNNYGGYTLVPSFYRRAYPTLAKKLKHLYQEQKDVYPARHVIALCRTRDSKREDLLELIHYLKKSYANKDVQRFDVLTWD